jgi:hypothetical protein
MFEGIDPGEEISGKQRPDAGLWDPPDDLPFFKERQKALDTEVDDA